MAVLAKSWVFPGPCSAKRTLHVLEGSGSSAVALPG